ncbi:MAG TPA: class I SAM-dependent methyltransferase [Pyrinomonadaceae bacterium]|jgi:SAM-dependent methyltransferase
MERSVLRMDALSVLDEVLAENRTARLIDDHIYSVLPDEIGRHHYDRRSTAYDLVVGTRLYNSVMWGSSPLDYIAFARQAVESNLEGRFLDAGCGSMLFTARAYLDCKRQIIAFDQSLAMLRRARKKLLKFAGFMPEHILLLQADLSDLPFRVASFHTILLQNVLHQFEKAAALIPNLKELLVENGHLFLTSLVANNRLIGDHYLKALYATGEFVRPRTKLELRELLDRALGQEISYRTRGNMAFITTMC